MHRRTPACAVLALLALATACGTDPGGRADTARPDRPATATCPTAEAAPAAPPTLVDGTPSHTPEARALTEALGPLVRGAYADVYASLTTDLPVGGVTLCVTDPARGRALVAEAGRTHPKADISRVVLRTSLYSRRQLNAGRDRLTDGMGPKPKTDYGHPIRTMGTGHGGDWIEVGSDAAGAASKEFRERLAKAAGVPVKVVVQDPVEALVG
ncbi:hypothetical protein ACH4SP_15255 [Streptomyces sp. NPDC021093]|uniref:hypothetical protein n=1 Tax=Streptomyces sp. NPDC021093 TaxID=3365112 RepID=UPI00378DABBB